MNNVNTADYKLFVKAQNTPAKHITNSTKRQNSAAITLFQSLTLPDGKLNP
jgi:hypothetical protein